MKAHQLVAAMAIGALLYQTGVVVYRSEPLELSRVEVRGNHAGRVTRQEVIDRAGVRRGDKLLSISPEEVAARVRAHPWVAEARVHRILPSKIRIDVVERRPALVVETAVGPHLVDAAGVVLQPGTDAFAKVVDLPPGTAVFTGERISTPEFAHALSIFNALPPTIRWKVLTIRARSIDGIAVETSQGVSIVYGAAEELEQKNYAAESLLAGAAGGTRARVIDVRAPSRPAVRPA